MQSANLVPVTYTDSQKSVQEEKVNEQRRQRFKKLMDGEKVMSDYDLWLLLSVGNDLDTTEDFKRKIADKLLEYHLSAALPEYEQRILSLDGGGIRGYMTIRIILSILNHSVISQNEFASRVHYFVGTSTGGLIAFCLSVGYSLSKLAAIYTDGDKYFKRTWESTVSPYPMVSARYPRSHP